MDGLLIVDKPSGPTSHDVVARMRRVFGEGRVGHTGTLDPLASGVLPLVLGRATRLAQFLSAADKCYSAVITLGVETNTCDAWGTPIGERYSGPLPDRAAINHALDQFRGTFLQQPPAFSAKKIAGRRSYELARQAARQDGGNPSDVHDTPARPAATRVTAHTVEVVAVSGSAVTLSVACSSGFYVRSLAHDLGRALGTGANLSSLRRTQSGTFTLAQSVALDEAERDPSTAANAVVPMKGLLLDLPGAVLTANGCVHARHGQNVGGSDFVEEPGPAPRVRLLDEGGNLIGIATPGSAPGLLHPAIVLM